MLTRKAMNEAARLLESKGYFPVKKRRTAAKLLGLRWTTNHKGKFVLDMAGIRSREFGQFVQWCIKNNRG